MLLGVRLLGLPPTGEARDCADEVCTRQVEALGRAATQTVRSRCLTVTFMAKTTPKDGNPPPSITSVVGDEAHTLSWLTLADGGAVITQRWDLTGSSVLGLPCE